jgi:hypothetical protein
MLLTISDAEQRKFQQQGTHLKALDAPVAFKNSLCSCVYGPADSTAFSRLARLEATISL